MQRLVAPSFFRSPYFIMGVWFCLNLIQAFFTELFHDEAYYWFYSRNLALGYHDHPPAIALMIKAGYSLFPNELGVRFFTVILNTAGIGLIYKMSGEENPVLFFSILFSMFITHISGLLAVPDSPFFFFTACFLLALKYYLENDNLKNALVLGLVIAGLLYSKYHGGMPVFFAVLSFPKLFFRKSFWGVFAVAFLLFLPHWIWMHQHDYSSLKFHLLYRAKAPFDFSRLTNYVGGILLVTGPLAGWLLMYSGIKYKALTEWERALKYCFGGILLFLLLLSFQTHIEANWAASALVPMTLLSYFYLKENAVLQKWFYRLAIPSFVLFGIFRVFLVWNFLPFPLSTPIEFHGWKTWAKQVDSLAQGNPVVFANSYQLPSKYMFYSGKPTWAASNLAYHRTQYDFSEIENSLQGKKVLYCIGWDKNGVTKFRAQNGHTFYYKWMENFRSFGKVSLYPETEGVQWRTGEEKIIPVKIKNEYGFPVDFRSNPDCMPYLTCTLLKGDRVLSTQKSSAPLDFVLKDTLTTDFTLKMPDSPGSYYMIFSLSQCEDLTMNGYFGKIKVN
ncbi:MAG: glycosyltransferase family 39 protein [Bacteroidia bacterium]|nr:glycosyltransferase family 39 protein [Bacteroidia bacterium]